MLRIDDVTLSAGGRDLLVDARFVVHPGDKVGFVGRNGSGKTTLFRAIAGEVLVDAGKITLRPGVVLGWLPQSAVSGSTRPVWDEARSRMASADERERRVSRAEEAVARGEEGAIERLDAELTAFRMSGGFTIDEQIGRVLHGLGFSKDDWTRPCNEFSGGWQMRIALARLLLSEPNLLLLDEPTNHLDMHARGWLADFLAGYPYAFMVASHDRHLLDKAAKRIVEVRSGTLHSYTGNFSSFLKQRLQRIAEHQASFESQQEEIARLQAFVDRFGAKATKARQAQSRQKVIDGMERIDAPERESRPRLRLPDSPGGASEPISLRNASLGWTEADVLADVTLHLDRGMRLAILGPNGAGKSTLLAALSGKLALHKGKRILGKDVRIGVFTQDLAQDLPADGLPLEVVLARAPRALPAQARGALGALGLSGDAALRRIGDLSGGEKARVALAGFAVQPFDLLLLDEPTNHLDAVTIDVLADALAEWNGTVVLVTHDRFVVERVCTHVAHVRDGKVTLREGVRPEDFVAVDPRKIADQADAEGSLSHAERKQKTRAAERARRRIGEVEREIGTLEQKAAAIDDRLFDEAADFERARVLTAERNAVQERIDALFAEWERLEVEAAS